MTVQRLPPLQDLLASAHAYEIPLARRFRGLDTREGVLIQGPAGWGEFAPFANYDVAADARWLSATMEASHGSWPQPVREQIEVNAIVPAVQPEDARQLVRESGCTVVKVKVASHGHEPADDIERVAAVREVLGTTGKLRVDANGAWSVSEAARTIGQLAQFDIEYVEQPCASLGECAELRRLIELPVAVDEGLRTAHDPLHISGLREAADLLVLKVAPLGGVGAAVAAAEAYGLPVVVSSALESSIGISAGLALAAALPSLDFACGLGSVRLLEADVVASPLVPLSGTITVTRPNVDDEKLQKVLATSNAASRWDQRIARAHEHLQSM